MTKKEDSACQIVKKSLDWIRVEKIASPSDKKMYQAKLHDGEVEVMILAQEGVRADLVVLDDNAAKKTAKYLGLTVTGTLGILLKAKKVGMIPMIAPVLEEIKKNGFYISEAVEQMVLREALLRLRRTGSVFSRFPCYILYPRSVLLRTRLHLTPRRPIQKRR